MQLITFTAEWQHTRRGNEVMKVYPVRFCKSLLWNKDQDHICWHRAEWAKPNIPFGKYKLKSTIQGVHIIECVWISSNDCAVYGQFMRQKVPSNDEKTISAWQKCLGFRLLRAEAVQVANFPSDVLTKTIIWFPLRAAVLSPVAKADWAASPLDILMRSAQVSP